MSVVHSAVAVTVNGTYVMLPESFEKHNATHSESHLSYLVTRFTLLFVAS